MTNAEHHAQWNDHLQDWLDGEAERETVFTAHLRDCALCQQRLASLERMDAALAAANPAPSLSATFDARLFARIDVVDETQRVTARQRAEREFADNLRALSRDWRRRLAFVLPGTIGGVGLTFALADQLATHSGGDAGTLQALLMGLIGAAIGGGCGWLAKGTT